MGHYPLLLIIPRDISDVSDVYAYIDHMLKTLIHNRICDWYTIGGQWNLYFASSLSISQYVDIELELVSSLKYNMAQVSQFMLTNNVHAIILDKNGTLHNRDTFKIYGIDVPPETSIGDNYLEILRSSPEDYLVMIDCHI
jgi:hypothetical protein